MLHEKNSTNHSSRIVGLEIAHLIFGRVRQTRLEQMRHHFCYFFSVFKKLRLENSLSRRHGQACGDLWLSETSDSLRGNHCVMKNVQLKKWTISWRRKGLENSWETGQYKTFIRTYEILPHSIDIKWKFWLNSHFLNWRCVVSVFSPGILCFSALVLGIFSFVVLNFLKLLVWVEKIKNFLQFFESKWIGNITSIRKKRRPNGIKRAR